MPESPFSPSLARFLQVAFWSVLAVVTVGSLLPANDPGPGIYRDKFIHAGAYATLGLLGLGAAAPARRPWVIAFIFGWSILIEFIQRYCPGRAFDGFDMVANGIGAGSAWLLFHWYLARRIPALPPLSGKPASPPSSPPD